MKAISLIFTICVGVYSLSACTSNSSPTETQALQSTNIGMRLSQVGVQKVIRENDMLLVTLANGKDFEVSVCAWNEEAEQSGGCTFGTSRKGRGYVLTVSPKLNYDGDSHAPGESKQEFLSKIDHDIRKVETQAVSMKEQQRHTAAAEDTWKDGI